VLVRCGERTAGASLGPAVPVCADAGKVHTDDIPVLVQEPGSGKKPDGSVVDVRARLPQRGVIAATGGIVRVLT